ncbi:MAG: flagellar M-ring protein FliF [Magnetococcales bacterium]|nr:flagellar M-ring protein FliF [Magnetococcales bacterium]
MAETSNELSESVQSGRQSGGFDLSRVMGGLPLAGRNSVVVAAIATVLVLASIIWFATRPAYKVLFSNLPEEEAGRVVSQLTKKNIPYELAGGGGTIKIPAEKVYDVRLEMATIGMPKKDTGVGFEIFDKTSLTSMTDFMQRMNYQRALQGELARTIESISSVQHARVHLVLPKQSAFMSEQKEASASVVMELARPLTAQQADGVVHLVASAVQGLDNSKVTLLDHKGNLIAGGEGADASGRMAPDKSLDLQRKVEKYLEDRAQAMLDRVLGAEHSIVRVTAELDLSRVERQEEKYDPEGQVARSEQTTNERSQGTFGAGGVPGVAPNDPNAKATAAGGTGSNQNRVVDRETINYEISKEIKRTVLPVGTIKRLSVAVMVDGVYEAPEKAGEPKRYRERSAEDKSKYQRIIEQAVGLRSDRGDTIEVTSIPFEPITLPEDSTGPWASREFQLDMAKYGSIFLILALLTVYVLRPLVKRIVTPEKLTEDALPGTIADLEQRLMAEGVGSVPTDKPLRLLIPDRTVQLAQQMINDHIDEAREIIRSWIAEE